jgi:hypothetical protein
MSEEVPAKEEGMSTRHFLAITMLLIASAAIAAARPEPTHMAKTTLAAAVQQEDDQATKAGAATGTVSVRVSPQEAYIFVDGQPMNHRSSHLKLAPGEHVITVYNYGFQPQTQKVTIVAGKNPEIVARLKPAGEKVSGPWGRIQIEGAPGDAAVFLNGTTPEFFVGHVDEMNNNFMATQRLIVPPGTHTLSIVRPVSNKTVWEGSVEVKPNQRLIVYLHEDGKPDMVYKGWSNGKKITSLKRFEAGTASATIAVAPVSGKLAADHDAIKCNEPVKLSWKSDGATLTTVTANNEKVAESSTGEVTVQPKQTTKYEFRAAGPGGIVTSGATVSVDTTVHTSLTPSANELRFVKVGDKVQEQGSANLNWTASNADSVRIDPIGAVNGSSGSETVQASPKASEIGPVDETQTYQITATNVCGGSDTTTASLRVVGSIEGEPVAQAEPPPQLPATASPLPLLGLLGILSLGVGGLLRKLRRH